MMVIKSALRRTPRDGAPSDDGTAPDGTVQVGRRRGAATVRSLPWRRWVIRGLELVALVFAVSLGGVSATSLFPTTVQTEHYRAEVRLSALPTFTSTIHSPTSFGDLDLEFTGPVLAPGIDATVQARESITTLFDRRVSIQSLEPSSKEISEALGSAAKELGLKFAAGVLVVGVSAIAVIAYARHRRPSAAQVASVGLAGLLALASTGIGISGTYQPGQLTTFRTTGLLSTFRSNATLLADVQTRAQQATPYVANLLALSAALQAKFIPAAITSPVAARLLLVSDIHGANQYPVMARIIRDEKITAVIDSGDLLNFGSVSEAELSGIFTSIGKLGVPYIFVRGNHDASSLADQDLLRRMARIKNVVLLEPKPQNYTEATVNGVVVAGFNDPRFFGDDNKNNNQKQQPAAESFNQAYTGRPRPDIVVSHEPGAVRIVDSATLLVNGHMHTDELEGNRIGAGTFTGGGTVSHFLLDRRPLDDTTLDKQRRLDQQNRSDQQKRLDQNPSNAGDPSGEVPGQPYAFDIAVFGEGCDLTSLTRYTFRNLIQGRPAYDDVSVINGKTIASREPGKRTCSAGLGMSTATVTLGR